MFDAIQGIKFGYVLCGIIWAVALGFAAGNYACSLVHRLPRGRLILDKKPYCGHCGAELQVRDLFPVVSALLLRHRCRYCRTPFPVSHTWTEILVGLLFVLAFFEHGFSERFLLIILIGIFLITLAAIEANERLIMGKILLCIAVFGMLNRVLWDGTIYHFFNGALFALVIGSVLWRKQIKPAGHIYTLPKAVELLAVGGLCVGDQGLILFLPLFAMFYALDWLIRKILSSFGSTEGPGAAGDPSLKAKDDGKPLITVAFGLAVILPVLWPKLMLVLQ